MTYIMMTDLNDKDTEFIDTCGLFLVGILFLALSISVIVMVLDIYQTLRKMIRKLIFKYKNRKAKKAHNNH